jgi:hypothetical protein
MLNGVKNLAAVTTIMLRWFAPGAMTMNHRWNAVVDH